MLQGIIIFMFIIGLTVLVGVAMCCENKDNKTKDNDNKTKDNDNKTKDNDNKTNKEKYLYSEKEFLSLLNFCENYPLYATKMKYEVFQTENYPLCVTRMKYEAFQAEILACKEKHRYCKENGLINKNFYTLLCKDLLFYISEKDKKQINYGKIEQKN